MWIMYNCIECDNKESLSKNYMYLSLVKLIKSLYMLAQLISICHMGRVEMQKWYYLFKFK